MNTTKQNPKELLDGIFYFDIHGHAEKLIPPVMRILGKTAIPKDITLKKLSGTGVNGFVICAIGDPNSFVKKKIDPYKSVKKQIAGIKKRIDAAGGVIALTSDEIKTAAEKGRPVFVLGIEGGDFIEDDPERLTEVYNEGVRVLVPVHYSKNQIGSISFGWGGKIIPEEEQTGLTRFGKTVIKKANRLGILIDMSHADEKTLIDAAAESEAPVMCSHTGPGGLQDFPRYLSDVAVKVVADRGGLIGLWPFYSRGMGMKDLETFRQYADYLIALAGEDCISIGTDINGVPGNMEGYENLNDAHKIVSLLRQCRISENGLEKICGENFTSLFRKVMKGVDDE